MVTREPVRGGFPDPSFGSLPGLERVRALGHGLVPRPPFVVLTGLRLVQIGAGAVTGSLPISPWLRGITGLVEPSLAAHPSMTLAVHTTVGPGIGCTARVLSMNYASPTGPATSALVSRARVLHTRRTMALAEAVVEDSDGRLVAHATALFGTAPIDPPPPPISAPLTPVPEPTYADPDPYLRPAPAREDVSHLFVKHGGLEAMRMIMAGDAPRPFAADFWGFPQPEFSEGRAAIRLPTSEWFCNPAREVDPSVVTLLMSATLLTAEATLVPPGRAIAVLDLDAKFLRKVAPDGRDLVARASVIHHEDDFMVSTVEIFDADGNRVAMGANSAMLIEPRMTRRRDPERVLATVMFTDIVGSTARANELGDARWTALLEEHNLLVRRELANFKGREVKMTGDGVLATFDSPTRALQSARAIRDGVARLGLQVYAGLHTGECELLGSDIGGMAVNVASRVLEEAAAGEILVTGTVRDLAAGSGVRFGDRGKRTLKGVPDEVQLYVVEG